MERREFLRVSTVGLLGSLIPVSITRAQEHHPNIVLIMTDEHRRDSVGVYGANPVQTPNLDRLASRGVVFDQFYATSPLCAPARTALATGRYPHNNGVMLNKSGQPGRKFSLLRRGERVITEMLANHGYQVAQFGVDHVHTDPPLCEAEYFAECGGWADYKEYMKEHNIPEMDMSPYKYYCEEVVMGNLKKFRYSSPKPGVHTVVPEHFWDTWIANQAVSFIEQYDDNIPFALNCFLWLPHPPVVVPEPYYSMYHPDSVIPSPNLMSPLTGKPQMHLRHAPGQLGRLRDRKGWLETAAVYYGMVTMADELIGKILDAVDKKGVLDNTLIIFAADHGEQLGSHSLFQKMVCYQESIHLPCIIRAPGSSPGRRRQLASHIDLMPTILDYADIPCPSRVQGQSLRGMIENPGLETTDAIFSEYNGNFGLNYFQRAVISKRYKYIQTDGDISEIYDLQEDPYELRNLMGKVDRNIEKELQDRLHSWQDETNDFLAFRH